MGINRCDVSTIFDVGFKFKTGPLFQDPKIQKILSFNYNQFLGVTVYQNQNTLKILRSPNTRCSWPSLVWVQAETLTQILKSKTNLDTSTIESVNFFQKRKKSKNTYLAQYILKILRVKNNYVTLKRARSGQDFLTLTFVPLLDCPGLKSQVSQNLF